MCPASPPLHLSHAIAGWVLDAAGARADCGAVVRRLERMTAGADLEALGDREAQALFGAAPGAPGGPQ